MYYITLFLCTLIIQYTGYEVDFKYRQFEMLRWAKIKYGQLVTLLFSDEIFHFSCFDNL